MLEDIFGGACPWSYTSLS